MLMNKTQPKEQGFASAIVVILLAVGFVSASAFGVWAFIGMQENQADVDKKIDAAVKVAVQKAETAKDAEFAELEKNPFRTYTGSQTYGTLTFDFPKNWNAFVEETSKTILMNFYAHPGVIPGLEKNVNFAFRAQIVDSPYQKEAAKYEAAQKSGKVTVTSFRPKLVESELGIQLKGEVVTGKQGMMVMLPQRDKTFMFWTESEEYVSDFTKIMDTMSFVP